MSALPLEYQAEPAIALDGNQSGGADGMDFVRTLLKEVPRVMNPGAVLVLEIGHERTYFEAAFPALAAVWLETSAGEDQVLLLTLDALTA
jgi:ribosomal protein L3 glutamine methyltransferase